MQRGSEERRMEHVCVLGLGYIGLPTASLLATKGFHVRGVDVRPDVISVVSNGELHFHEPDLDILVKSAVGSGNLTVATEPAPAEIFIIAVPTPVTDTHAPDGSFIEAAANAIAPHLAPGNLVILESTSPVGMTEQVGRRLAELRPDLRFASRGGGDGPGADRVFLAHCPERVLPGRILRELVDNDRIVGGVDRVSGERAQAFYRKFVNGAVHVTDSRTAELCKLAENAYRDVNIALANELSLVCDRLGIDPWGLIDLANRHPRVSILRPGPGVGGHCIAVDPWFIVDAAPDLTRLIRTARDVNDEKPAFVVRKVLEKAERFRDPIIACLGLAYKADISDLRESPALEIVRTLASHGSARVVVVEPHIDALPSALSSLGVVQEDLGRAVQQADIIVLLVDHRAFMDIDRALLKEKVVIDTRGAWR